MIFMVSDGLIHECRARGVAKTTFYRLKCNLKAQHFAV